MPLNLIVATPPLDHIGDSITHNLIIAATADRIFNRHTECQAGSIHIGFVGAIVVG